MCPNHEAWNIKLMAWENLQPDSTKTNRNMAWIHMSLTLFLLFFLHTKQNWTIRATFVDFKYFYRFSSHRQTIATMKPIQTMTIGKNVKHLVHIQSNFPKTPAWLIKIHHLYDKIHRIRKSSKPRRTNCLQKIRVEVMMAIWIRYPKR